MENIVVCYLLGDTSAAYSSTAMTECVGKRVVQCHFLPVKVSIKVCIGKVLNASDWKNLGRGFFNFHTVACSLVSIYLFALAEKWL